MLQPRPGWVLVRQSVDPDKVGQIIVPDTAKGRPLGPGTAYQATVVAVGPPGYRYDPQRKKVPRRWCDPDIVPGDVVVIEALSNHAWDGYQLVRSDDVVAVLEGAEIEPIALRGHQPYLGKGAEQAEQAKREMDREMVLRREMGR